jgi:microcystin-dependent protein
MSQPFIGQIIIFAGNFAIRGYAMCNGQLLSIAQNTALFSILGTTYGGNGQTTFGLPDLRGRFPNHQGQGAGLSNYSLGQQGGTESATVTTNQMPQHVHPFTFTIPANDGDADKNTPSVTTRLAAATGGNIYSDGGATVQMPGNTGNTGITGGGQPLALMNSYLTLNFLIALEGIFPSRN